MKDITILILITLTITLGGCLTTIPVFAVTNKYIETGTPSPTQAPLHWPPILTLAIPLGTATNRPRLMS